MKRASLVATLFVAAVIAAVTLASGQESGPLDCGEAEGTEDVHPLVTANNGFAIDILKEQVRERPGENVFFSPLSISLALLMTYNGASGATQEAMAVTLGVGELDRQAVNSAVVGLLHKFSELGPEVQLNIANSIWAKKGVRFREDFLGTNMEYYCAQTTALDFGNPASLKTINGWVSDRTQGKIDSIIDRISPLHVMFLINAIYFNGTWLDEFRPEDTADRPFHLEDGGTEPHPMMTRSGKYSYLKGGGFQAVKLPYLKREIGMYIFLPTTNTTLDQFLHGLEQKSLETWLDKFVHREGEVVIPRFEMEYESELNETLAALGMDIAFGPGADFSGMTGERGLFIDYVKHKAVLEVDEEGTEAAAVTVVAMAVASAISPAPPPFKLVADRPFFFVIRDDSTGTLLFAGVLREP